MMNGPQTRDAEKLRREALIAVGNGLRDRYGGVLKEDIPKRLTDLLRLKGVKISSAMSHAYRRDAIRRECFPQ